MKRTYLISYSCGNGVFGRFFNYRDDDSEPSEADIESMERKIAQRNGFSVVCIISVSRLADSQ